MIAARTGTPTVGDFRAADMAAGGQGAPLVPYVDALLLRDEKTGRVALNLGGIGNVTVLPSQHGLDHVMAFDTGPGNMLIDGLVAHYTKGRLRFDRDAKMARRGRCVLPLLEELLTDPYLKVNPPKSTGREYYGSKFVDKLLEKARKYHPRRSAESADYDAIGGGLGTDRSDSNVATRDSGGCEGSLRVCAAGI